MLIPGEGYGSLPTERVILVLRRHDVIVKNVAGGEGGTYMKKGNQLEVQFFLEDEVDRFTIRRLANRFDIDIVDFYYDETEDDP